MMLFHPSAPSVERGKPQIISLSAVKPPAVCAADNLRFEFGLFKKSRALSIYPAARSHLSTPLSLPLPPSSISAGQRVGPADPHWNARPLSRRPNNAVSTYYTLLPALLAMQRNSGLFTGRRAPSRRARKCQGMLMPC